MDQINDISLQDCPMRITLMYQNRSCTAIDVNFLQNRIKIQNYTKDILHRAFGVKETPTWEDFIASGLLTDKQGIISVLSAGTIAVSITSESL